LSAAARINAPRRVLVGLAASAVAAGAAAFLLVGTRSRPNVLLVTIDTLRADRLGCYGYRAAETPVLDALAARGVRFSTAVAHAPLTAPSHASILTGLLPLGHGVRDNGTFVLPPSLTTLAEGLRGAGYRTAAFVSGFPLDHRFGFARGFETYDDRLLRGGDTRRASYVERPAATTTREAVAWVRGTRAPWFAWVHYFDPHSPYEPPPDLAARFAASPYDGEVASVDRELGRLLAAAEAGPARTLVLVTSDHGESLGEHGEATHGVFVYDSTLRVPWIMAGPGIPRGRVSAVVARGIDVAPTLLDYAGLRTASAMQGRSLRPAADGREMEDAAAYAESLFCQLNLGWAPLHAWRTARFKLIDAPRMELYDLAADPAEARDISTDGRSEAKSLRSGLRHALEARPPEASTVPTGEARERLRALGYVGGTAPAHPSGRDPKDGIALVERLERGLAEARAHPPVAVEELTAVLAEEPDAPLARRYRAIAYQYAGRYPESIADIRALEARGPLSLDDLTVLAESLRLADRPEEALVALDRAAAVDPRAPEPALLRGRALRAMGRSDEAGAAFRRALALDPGNAEARRGLGELALERGAVDEAASLLEANVAADPTDAVALVKLGVARMRGGRVDEALALFERAVALDPDNPEALLDLAGALGKSGRSRDAIPYFEKAIEVGGPTTTALNGLGVARLESGDTAGAARALRESLALDPKQPGIADLLRKVSGGHR
jgi:arylsulfatase A-like enzyme/tetratricopeptide (TPR) repeat protein